MKRIFAIVLLSVHLFNIGGYTLFYQYFINKADSQMTKQIFANKIDDKKYIELKVPVHFPTLTNWDDYAVVEGQIQVKDVYYNYVKLKMTTDTMYLICLPNVTKTRLEKANVITASNIADVPLNKKATDSTSKKISVLSEYNLQSFTYTCVRFGKTLNITGHAVNAFLSNPYIESPGKPPNFSC